MVKEQEPEGIVSAAALPIVLLYPLPGVIDNRNSYVYKGKFVTDIYASSMYGAILLGEAIYKALNDKQFSYPNMWGFKVFHAWDSSFATGIGGVKGYRYVFTIDYVHKEK